MAKSFRGEAQMKKDGIEQPKMTGRGLLAYYSQPTENTEGPTARPSTPLLGAEDPSDVAKKIERSIAYMAQHLGEPLPVAALAAKASLSSSHFFALFKRQTGCAPMRYFTRLRLQYACHLLDTTSSPVKEIADALGYKDQFYFSRVFKQVNHMAPSEYRLRRRENRGKESEQGCGLENPSPSATPDLPKF